MLTKPAKKLAILLLFFLSLHWATNSIAWAVTASLALILLIDWEDS